MKSNCADGSRLVPSNTQPHIQGTETVTVARGKIQVPFLRRALIADVVVVYDERQAQTAAPARKGPGAMIRQSKQLQERPKSPDKVAWAMGCQLGRSIRMFNEIDLVDDIDQALRFDQPPEHLVHAQPQFPFIVTNAAEQQQVGFTQVHVGTARVRDIVTKKGARVKLLPSTSSM